MPHRPSTPTPAVAVTAPPTDEIGPRDCVREFPTLAPDVIELVAFDWQGRARFRSEVPLIEDIEGWSMFLLRRCRKCFPAPQSHLQLIG